MSTFGFGLVALVAALHFLIAAVEMFAGRLLLDRLFGPGPAEIDGVRAIVANAGLYNGFVAAGLAWFLRTPAHPEVLAFFLGFVVIAGVFGAVTLKRPQVFALQSIPAALALFVMSV